LGQFRHGWRLNFAPVIELEASLKKARIMPQIGLFVGAAKASCDVLLALSFARRRSEKLPRNDIAVTTRLRVSSRAFN
jgi:hypothetical protein